VILVSAIEAFAQRGYSGTSIQHIIDATGLSKPTLYYYFTNKADLFRAILDYAYDESFDLLKSGVAAEKTTEQKLVAAASAWFAFARRHQNLMRLVLSANFAAPKEVPPESIDHVKRRRHFDALLEVIRRGQSEGELDTAYDATDMVHGIFGAISHRIRTYLLSGEGHLDPALAQRIVLLYLNGARPKH
jgi:AcrR family transcriptional regulator